MLHFNEIKPQKFFSNKQLQQDNISSIHKKLYQLVEFEFCEFEQNLRKKIDKMELSMSLNIRGPKCKVLNTLTFFCSSAKWKQ